VTLVGEKRNACRLLVERPEGKRKLWKYSSRWEGNIKMDIKRLWWDGVGQIYLSQVEKKWLVVVQTVMKFWVPYNAGNSLNSWETIRFSRRTLFHGFSKAITINYCDFTFFTFLNYVPLRAWRNESHWHLHIDCNHGNASEQSTHKCTYVGTGVMCLFWDIPYLVRSQEQVPLR
jgi:hypothetical protein